MVNTTEEETEMKKAGDPPAIRHDKKVSDWLNHSLALARNRDRPMRFYWQMR